MRALYVFIFTSLVVVSGWCQNTLRSNLETDRAAIIMQLERTAQLLSTTNKEAKASVADYKLLEKQMQQRKAYIKNLDSSIDLASAQIDSTRSLVKDLEAYHSQLLSNYAELARIEYIRSKTGFALVGYLEIEALNDAIVMWRYRQRVKEYLAHEEAKIQLNKQELAITIAALAHNKTELEDLQEVKLRETDKLSDTQKKLKQSLTQIQGESERLKNVLSKQKAQRKKLNDEIERVIIAELQGSATNSRTTASATAVETSFSRGLMPWPVLDGVVISDFGVQRHPTLRGVTTDNNGIDIMTTTSLVTSIADGEVVAIRTIDRQSNMVIVKSGNHYVVYNNLLNTQVTMGEVLQGGDTIGNLSLNGQSGSILHLEIWNNKQKLNPIDWLRSQE